MKDDPLYGETEAAMNDDTLYANIPCYLVPEGMAIDAEKGIFRHRGDLGNLVRLAEAMKCFHIVTGISPVWGDTVKIMPRLPKGRHVLVKDFPVVNTNATVDMETACPTDGTQSRVRAFLFVADHPNKPNPKPFGLGLFG